MQFTEYLSLRRAVNGKKISVYPGIFGGNFSMF